MLPFERAKLGPPPEIGPHNNRAAALCIAAWNELYESRSDGFNGRGGIPYEAISLWADRNRLDADLFQLVVDVIRILDIDRGKRIASERAVREAKSK